VETAVPNGDYWQVAAVSNGVWCVIRVIAVLITCAAAYLFESAFVFRHLCCIALPSLAAIDMIGQMNHATHIYCLHRNICSLTDTQWTERSLHVMAWRDLIGAILFLVAAGMAIWLTALFGTFSNTHYLPRGEHRKMSKRLDQETSHEQETNPYAASEEAKINAMLRMK
jgi:hypothetical protein